MIQLASPKTSLETVTITMEDHLKSHVSPWLAPLLYMLGHRLVFPCYFGRLEISGQENIPVTGPVILAPTHRSRWDALLVPYATGRLVTGRDPRFMVSANETTGIQGWFVRNMGGFPINPARPTVGSLRHGVELLQQGEMLVIFPEGDIYRDGSLHQLKPGLARLALGAESSQPGLGVKVVPISIQYSQPFPQWGCDVNIRIGAPLGVADCHTGSVKEKAQQLTSNLEVALKQLSGQSITIKCHSALKMPF
ncbi:MAG: 1-acyl-sn-glycerol-3-phosphate acyltransferase [Chroococcidiopsidaceae cyanobacterium CP_BM_ER_R8_30]|nr:1-acyl-sn-glycerol-3-phosphate acyltransferase [Chroococcidiopsidaceae cyanobacterium CP_BM_ER_R8_30]